MNKNGLPESGGGGGFDSFGDSQTSGTGGGSYFDASDKAALGVSMAAAVAQPYVPPPFKVIGSDGETVAQGTVGGADIVLLAGTYQIQIGTDGASVIKDVVVNAGQMTEADFVPD